jgi:hypothetical protein
MTSLDQILPISVAWHFRGLFSHNTWIPSAPWIGELLESKESVHICAGLSMNMRNYVLVINDGVNRLGWWYDLKWCCQSISGVEQTWFFREASSKKHQWPCNPCVLLSYTDDMFIIMAEGMIPSTRSCQHYLTHIGSSLNPNSWHHSMNV